MLAPKRSLRVAPVPPKTADLTRPGAAARAMAGRDEGTGVWIEPRNNRARRGLAVTIVRRLQSLAQWWVRLTKPHTQKFGYFRAPVGQPLPISVPVPVQTIDPQREHMFRMLDEPPGVRKFQARLRDIAVRAFDFPRADRKAFGEGFAIIQSLLSRSP